MGSVAEKIDYWQSVYCCSESPSHILEAEQCLQRLVSLWWFADTHLRYLYRLKHKICVSRELAQRH